MRYALAALALGSILTFGITTAPAQVTYPTTTQPSTPPSQGQTTDTTTPAQTTPTQVPSSQPGTQTPAPAKPAPAQVQPAQTQPSLAPPAPPSQTAPLMTPNSQETQTPAPAEVTTPQSQAPSKEMIDRQCYQGYGPSPGSSAMAPQAPAVRAQSGGTQVTQQVDVTQTTRTNVIPSSLCAGWIGAPAGQFPNPNMTPEFPVMSAGGVEMLPLAVAWQRWENFEGGTTR